MNVVPTSPELPPGEPHPAVRLAELVCALIAAVCGPSWLWGLLPGGRAVRAQLQGLARDFAALMQRLAAAPPILPIITAPLIAPPRRRPRGPTGDLPPRRRARQSGRPRAAKPAAPRNLPALFYPLPPSRPPSLAQLRRALRHRRRRTPLGPERKPAP